MTKPVQKAEYGKKSNRKVILLCLVILVLAIGSIGPMRAYFTDMETSTNKFTVGEVTVQASVADGNLVVTNAGRVDCWIRVFAEMERPEMTMTVTDTNTTEWSTKNADGYYYYQKAVAPGDSTEPLFTGVSADEGAEMIVYAEGIQAEGFNSAEQAFSFGSDAE